jgi:hypothetical protein
MEYQAMPIMSKILGIIFSLFFSTFVLSQSLGNLAKFPPETKEITVTTESNGMPKVEPFRISLFVGNYYRLKINCPDVKDDLTGWRIEMPELLRNSHLRLVTVGDIEIHLQGLSFNAIECDEVGSAHVSFVPIKPGEFDLYVGNVPSALGRPMGESGIQEKGKFVIGKLIVQ